MVEIIKVTKPTEETLESLNLLLPQLSNSAKPISFQEYNHLLESDAVHLYFARLEKRIVAMLSLVIFPIPTGKRAWVEDVVVDSSARGKGVGKALCMHALREAKAMGVGTVDLTSRPSREAANKLYQSIGFTQRETNVYRFLNG